MANDGITTGFPDGTFRPADSVTRGAMAAFLYRTANPGSPAPPPCATQPFADVATTFAFCPHIDWLVDNGIATGFGDGTYRPGETVSRQAMAAFLYRLENGATPPPPCPVAAFSDVPSDHTFCPHIRWMAEEGIAGGFPDGTFRPTDSVTRGAMAAFIQRFVHRPT
jgi:endo-1,4-beta-xylanase